MHDVVLLTGTTQVNDTLEHLLTLCRPAARVVVVGPTVGLLPDAFLRRGVDVLGGIRITAAESSEGRGLSRAGAPITSFAVESLLDELARKLDIDPLVLRERNAARNGTKTHYGPTHQNIGFEAVLAAVKSHSHWKTPLKEGHGRGMACGFWFNIGGESTAQVHINEDGSVTAATGSPDIGGSRASIGMMVAEVLGVPASRVRTIVADTATIGFTHVTGGSRVTFATGMSATQAAENCRAGPAAAID